MLGPCPALLGVAGELNGMPGRWSWKSAPAFLRSSIQIAGLDYANMAASNSSANSRYLKVFE